MKKLLALFLAIMMVLTLAACGSKDSKDDEEEKSSYKDAVDNMMSVMYKGKANKVKDLAPKEYWTYMEDEYGKTADEAVEAYETRYENNIENWEDQFGKNFKVTYKIVDKSELSESKLESLKENLNQNYNIDEKRIRKAYTLEVSLTASGNDSEDTATNEIISVQIGSDWYPVNEYGQFSVSF